MFVRACVFVRKRRVSRCRDARKQRKQGQPQPRTVTYTTHAHSSEKKQPPPARTVMSNGQYHAPRGPYSHTEVCVDRTPIMHVYHIEQRARGTSLSRSVGLHGLLPKQVSNHPNVLKSAAATAVAAEVAYWWYVRQANPCPRKHLSHLWHYKRL